MSSSLKKKFARLKSLAQTRKKYSKVVNEAPSEAAEIDVEADEGLGPIHKRPEESLDFLNKCCCALFFILLPTNIGMCILISLLQFAIIRFEDIPGFAFPDDPSAPISDAIDVPSTTAISVPAKVAAVTPPKVPEAVPQQAKRKASPTISNKLRKPVPNNAACDWGIKNPTCEICASYYDPRSNYGYNEKGKCVWVPSQSKCFANEWAKSQKWEIEVACGNRRDLGEPETEFHFQVDGSPEVTTDAKINLEEVE